MIRQEKQTLREQMKKELSRFEDREGASDAVAERLRGLDSWRKAGVIYVFSPLKSEPDWRRGFADEGKVLAWPRVEGEEMVFYVAEGFRRGGLGVWEPEGGERAPEADLVLVPGLAFDAGGYRLGRGRGFYDRWLSGRGRAVAVGVCFEMQIVPALPREEHDRHVDVVVTEARG